MAARNPLLPILAAVMAMAAAASLWRERNENASVAPPSAVERPTQAAQTTDPIEHAFRDRRSNVQVEGHGTVARLLKDDHEGSRHQRFIITLASGRTLLVAHNIDLAPRVDALREGDTVRFFGEYEWNDKGGVLHWTHHDPQGRHIGGWLEHAGRRYQ